MVSDSTPDESDVELMSTNTNPRSATFLPKKAIVPGIVDVTLDAAEHTSQKVQSSHQTTSDEVVQTVRMSSATEKKVTSNSKASSTGMQLHGSENPIDLTADAAECTSRKVQSSHPTPGDAGVAMSVTGSANKNKVSTNRKASSTHMQLHGCEAGWRKKMLETPHWNEAQNPLVDTNEQPDMVNWPNPHPTSLPEQTKVHKFRSVCKDQEGKQAGGSVREDLKVAAQMANSTRDSERENTAASPKDKARMQVYTSKSESKRHPSKSNAAEETAPIEANKDFSNEPNDDKSMALGEATENHSMLVKLNQSAGEIKSDDKIPQCLKRYVSVSVTLLSMMLEGNNTAQGRAHVYVDKPRTAKHSEETLELPSEQSLEVDEQSHIGNPSGGNNLPHATRSPDTNTDHGEGAQKPHDGPNPSSKDPPIGKASNKDQMPPTCTNKYDVIPYAKKKRSPYKQSTHESSSDVEYVEFPSLVFPDPPAKFAGSNSSQVHAARETSHKRKRIDDTSPELSSRSIRSSSPTQNKTKKKRISCIDSGVSSTSYTPNDHVQNQKVVVTKTSSTGNTPSVPQRKKQNYQPGGKAIDAVPVEEINVPSSFTGTGKVKSGKSDVVDSIAEIGDVIPIVGTGNCGYIAVMMGLLKFNVRPFTSITAFRRYVWQKAKIITEESWWKKKDLNTITTTTVLDSIYNEDVDYYAKHLDEKYYLEDEAMWLIARMFDVRIVVYTEARSEDHCKTTTVITPDADETELPERDFVAFKGSAACRDICLHNTFHHNENKEEKDPHYSYVETNTCNKSDLRFNAYFNEDNEYDGSVPRYGFSNKARSGGKKWLFLQDIWATRAGYQDHQHGRLIRIFRHSNRSKMTVRWEDTSDIKDCDCRDAVGFGEVLSASNPKQKKNLIIKLKESHGGKTRDFIRNNSQLFPELSPHTKS